MQDTIVAVLDFYLIGEHCNTWKMRLLRVSTILPFICFLFPIALLVMTIAILATPFYYLVTGKSLL